MKKTFCCPRTKAAKSGVGVKNSSKKSTARKCYPSFDMNRIRQFLRIQINSVPDTILCRVIRVVNRKNFSRIALATAQPN